LTTNESSESSGESSGSELSIGNLCGGAGNRTRVRKPSACTSTCVARVLFSPPCAHERARSRRAAQSLAPCVDRAAGDQPDQLRLPVSSGRLILWTALRLFFRQREQARYRPHLWFPTRIYEVSWILGHAAQTRWPPSKPIAPFHRVEWVVEIPST